MSSIDMIRAFQVHCGGCPQCRPKQHPIIHRRGAADTPACGGSWMRPANFVGRLCRGWRHVTCKNCLRARHDRRKVR